MTTLPKTMPKLLWQVVKKNRLAVAFLIGAAIVNACSQVILPYTMKLLYSSIQEYSGELKDMPESVTPYALYFIGAAFAAFMSYRLIEINKIFFRPKVEGDIRKTLFAYLQNHSQKFYSDNFAGSLANKITEIATASPRIITMGTNMFSTLLMFTLFSLLLLQIHFVFAMIIISWISLHILITLIILPYIKAAAKRASDIRSSTQGKVIDSLSNYNNVKIFSARKYEYNFISEQVNTSIKANRKAWLFNEYMFAALSFLHFIVVEVILLLAQIYAISIGIITIADFIFITFAINSIYGWMFGLSHEMGEVTHNYGASQQAFISINSPHSVKDMDESKTIKPRDASINMDNITFYYNEGVPVFENFSLTIPEGQKVGIVGHSGAGKSTLSHLLLRYYDLKEGTIYIGGEDISKVTQDSLRQIITMVPQDTSMFHRSVMENIRYGRSTATDEEVYEASKKAKAHDFITRLTKGYDSLVGERGIKLSVGQRQRIAIARAILKNAPIVVMDEATSALDSETEALIQESMNNLMIGKTSIIIAHRLSTLKSMDRILVIENGMIIEDGTHHELIQKRGRYYDLWSMQQSGFLTGG